MSGEQKVKIPWQVMRDLDITPQDLRVPAVLPTPSPWMGHVFFARWIMRVFQPRVFVELGTHHGFSYFTCCETVRENSLPTRCHAVDHWQGDSHSGKYGADIFEAVSSFNRRYEAFSTLYRMCFDDALAHFDDKSVDLLHVDGLHTYEAVKHDFKTWLPKLSDRALVLFHDTIESGGDFGVWRFWEEVRTGHPHMNFHQSHGLGVLGVGDDFPEPVKHLFQAAEEPEACNTMRLYFIDLSRRFMEAAYGIDTPSS